MDSTVKIDSGIWSEPWFERMPSQSKLVYLYLISNHKSTGRRVYDITQKRISEDTGLDGFAVEASLQICEAYGKIKLEKFTITLID